jgi:hypothetical protein
MRRNIGQLQQYSISRFAKPAASSREKNRQIHNLNRDDGIQKASPIAAGNANANSIAGNEKSNHQTHEQAIKPTADNPQKRSPKSANDSAKATEQRLSIKIRFPFISRLIQTRPFHPSQPNVQRPELVINPLGNFYRSYGIKYLKKSR